MRSRLKSRCRTLARQYDVVSRNSCSLRGAVKGFSDSGGSVGYFNMSALHDDTIRKLESIYAFDDRKKVTQFLTQNRFLLPILKDAVPLLIEKHFPGSPKSLRAAEDQLAVDVTVRLTAQEAFEKLNQLDTEWSVVIGRRDRGEVFVQLDYK